MKSTFFIFLLTLATLAGYSQQIKDNTVPKIVIEALENQYPKAKVKSWEKPANYIAQIKDEGQNGKVEISGEGEWIGSIFMVEEKELPSPILGYIKDNYPVSYGIMTAEFHEKNGAENFYFVKVKKQGASSQTASELSFNAQGGLLKKFDPEPIVKESTENKTTENKAVETSKTDSKKKKKEKVKKNDDDLLVSGDDEKENKSAEKSSETEKEVKKEKTKSVKTPPPAKETVKKEAKKPLPPPASVSPNLIPTKAKTTFNKKFPKSTDVKWDTLSDFQYSCSFLFHEQRTSIKLDSNGTLLTTKTLMDKNTMYQPITSWLEKTYKSYKLITAEKVIRSDKNNYYFVKINVKKKGVYQIYFDKTGRMDKIIEPDIIDDKKDNTEEVSSIDAKFNSEYERELSKGIDASVQNDAKVNERELPSPIFDYMKAHYPNDVKIKKSLLTDDPELGNCYYIKAGREGVNQQQIQLYFDINGKLLKLLDPNKEVLSDDAKEDEKPTKTNTSYEEKISVPDAVIKTLKAKFESAAAVNWTTEDTLYSASFQHNGMRYRVSISQKGSWIETASPVKEDAIPTFITDPISKEIKNYVLLKCEKVVRFDRKNYYYVEVSEKKKKGKEPQSWKYSFSSTGKLLSKSEL